MIYMLKVYSKDRKVVSTTYLHVLVEPERCELFLSSSESLSATEFAIVNDIRLNEQFSEVVCVEDIERLLDSTSLPSEWEPLPFSSKLPSYRDSNFCGVFKHSLNCLSNGSSFCTCLDDRPYGPNRNLHGETQAP